MKTIADVFAEVSRNRAEYGVVPIENSTEGVVTHTLERLARFGVMTRHGSTVAVRLVLPPLTARQRERLPRYLANAYPSP